MTMISRKRFLAPYPQFADYLKVRCAWLYPTHDRILDPDYFVVDFNVRPAAATIEARESFEAPVDWDAAVEKTMDQVARLFSRCGFSGARARVEGICDDGTMACVLITPRPYAEPLNRVAKLISQKALKDLRKQRLGAYGQLTLHTMDKSNRRRVTMIAEDFFVTPSKKEGTIHGTIPLREWAGFAVKLDKASR